jgi:LPXTG-motif cell wall-anchored protein
MSISAVRGDYFDRARTVAVALLLAAAVAATVGSLLDWVTISNPPRLARDVDFGDATVEAPRAPRPYTGVEARDGWVVIGGAVVVVVGAAGLALRRRSVYSALALLATVVIGAVAIADYRAIGDVTSSISNRMEITGDPEPAIGIMLVAAAAVVGLIGAVLGIVATPSRATR